MSSDEPTMPSAAGDATVPAGATEAAQAARPSTDSPVRVGSILKDRFVIEAELGRGGMGAVFRARDLRRVEARDPHPHVAVKVLSGAFQAHPRAFVALQRETDKAQKLAHPNIVTVYDFDRDGELFFMTMELLEGQSLDRLIGAEGAAGLQAAKRVPVLRAIAAGLAYAHEKGIVHSDMKPQNVFLTDDGRVKLLDFGIARAASSIGAAADSAFDAGELGALTPAYASPEMLEGQEPEPADDVYSLGLIACELFSGKHPFMRQRATEARDAGLRPPRPPGLNARQWRTVAAALQFERSKRVPDASRFLQRFDGLSVLARSLLAVLLLTVAGFSAALILKPPGPEVPFDELPQAVQAEFLEELAEVDRAMPFLGTDLHAINDVRHYIDRAWRLHPLNPDLQQRIDTVMDSLSAQAARASGDARRDRALLSTMRSMRETEAFRHNDELQRLIERVERRLPPG